MSKYSVYSSTNSLRQGISYKLTAIPIPEMVFKLPDQDSNQPCGHHSVCFHSQY